MFLKLSDRFGRSLEDKKKLQYTLSKIAYKKESDKSIRIVPSQVWEDEKGVDAAVLASAQHVSSFDTIPGLSLASRLVLGHKLSGPSN